MGFNIDGRRKKIATELRQVADDWRENGAPPTLDGVAYPLFKAFGSMELTPDEAFEVIACCVDPACEAVNRDA